MTAIYFDSPALFIEGIRDAFVAGSLVAQRDGDMIRVCRMNEGSTLFMGEFWRITRQDGTGFANAEEAKAYLDAEFVKRPIAAPRRFVHDQPNPASVWTVPHNLGTRPVVTVLSPGGLQMLAAVTHLSDNVLQVLLDDALPGQAVCI